MSHQAGLRVRVQRRIRHSSNLDFERLLTLTSLCTRARFGVFKFELCSSGLAIARSL